MPGIPLCQWRSPSRSALQGCPSAHPARSVASAPVQRPRTVTLAALSAQLGPGQLESGIMVGLDILDSFKLNLEWPGPVHVPSRRAWDGGPAKSGSKTWNYPGPSSVAGERPPEIRRRFLACSLES